MKSRHALLATLLLAGTAGAVAVAEVAPTTTSNAGTAAYDSQSLPTIKGKIAQYSLTPRGDVDGVILDDGTEVHLPPHLGVQLVAIVKAGDAVTIRGLKARALPLVQAVSITNDATKQAVTDNGPSGAPPPGPPGARPDQQALTSQSRIKAQLHGPRGEMNGVLLENGTIVRLPPPEAARLTSQLAVGQPLYARGFGMSNSLGTVIAAQSIGPSQTQLAQIQTPPPPPRGPRRDRMGPPAPPASEAAPGAAPNDAPPPPAQ